MARLKEAHMSFIVGVVLFVVVVGVLDARLPWPSPRGERAWPRARDARGVKS